MKYRPDYLGVHAPVYHRIAAGEREGWSSAEEVAGMLAQLDWAAAETGVPIAGKVLEFGCGDGCLTAALAAREDLVISGIEVVPAAVELARQRLARRGLTARIDPGSVTALPYLDHAFAAVIDGHCLHCIVPPDRAACLAEARRVLRPGGLFVVITMCGDPAVVHAGEFDPVTRCHVVDGIAGRYYGTVAGILREIADAGFAVQAHRIWPARHDRENDDLVVAAVRQ